MARRSDALRAFNVSVVGLSGTEKEKGQTGIGKSCFCNRFMRTLADDYSVDHISVLSQSDFSGRVVNNDHFLYWGDVVKTSEEGIEFLFQVIEQTEFIDDATFQPFKGGKMEPYVKRCTATKLTSAEKLMYICKNQLGIEKEYEQKIIPDGKINIDGFLCLFDVSVVPGRSLEKQVDVVTTILNNIIKAKKPVVVVTSKHDDANEIYVKEAEKIVSRKEFKGAIPLVETSAHENVNVDIAFFVLAQMIDRTKGRSKIVPFSEAFKIKKEFLEYTTESYQRLIRIHVTDYRTVWSYTAKKLGQYEEFVHFVEMFGMDSAQKLFKRHVRKLKDEHIAVQVQGYMQVLSEVLQEILPNLSVLHDRDWASVQLYIKDHPDFSQYFYECPDDMTWTECDLDDTNETRIPFDVLDSTEAETVYKNHLNSLQQEQKKLEWKVEFKQLLEATGYVTPGKLLSEVRVLFMGRECFEALTEQECQMIYEHHQREIIEKAKHNFQELLLEHADLFYHFKSIAPTGTITQDDIKEITDALQDDSRYKNLDRLDQDRKLMLFQHLGFVHCPIREHCPAYPNCVDALIERILGTKAHRSSSWNHNLFPLNSENNILNLAVIGINGLAEELANEIHNQSEDDEYEIGGYIYSLDYKVIDGDVTLPKYSFKTPEFSASGCICVYSNSESFDYVRDSLEKTHLLNIEVDDRLPFQGLPLVIIFLIDSTLEEEEVIRLKEEGQNLSESLQCPFIDVSLRDDSSSPRFSASLIAESLNQLIESMRHRAGFFHAYQSIMQSSEPDIRIIMCMFCGDPYSVENILGPLLTHQCCFLSGDRSIILETFLGDSKRKVEVIISSFHGANAFREELVHGFILVYSIKRKASLATLNAFSMNIPNLPIQILAVTDSGGASAFFSSDLSHHLITEGNATADRLQAHFMTTVSTCQQKTAFFTPFFKEVWEKKPEIEQAFHMEEPVHLNDSEECALDDCTGKPVPPPRRESYHLKIDSNDGSGSEIYERLPTDTSVGEDGNELLSQSFPEDRLLSPSDNSDIYSHVGTFEQDNSESLNKSSDTKSTGKIQRWADESITAYQHGQDSLWNNYKQHAYTTGRRYGASTKPRPKGNSHTLKVKDAVPNIHSSYDGEYAYTLVQDAVCVNTKSKLRHRRGKEHHSYSDSDSDWSSLERRHRAANLHCKVNRKPTPHKRIRKKRGIPVPTPRIPSTRPINSTDGLNVGNFDLQKETGECCGDSSDKANSESLSDASDISDPEVSNSSVPARHKYQSKHSNKLRRNYGNCPPPIPSLPNLRSSSHKSVNHSNFPTCDVYTSLKPRREIPYSAIHDEESGLDVSSPRDVNAPVLNQLSKCKENEKSHRKEKQKSKTDEKQRRRRQKEEKQKKLDKEKEKKKSKHKSKSSAASNSNTSAKVPLLLDFAQSQENLIPLLLEKCVKFIEEEGLDSEGIYRVPGNRAHVDLLFQKFEEDPNVNIRDLDIPVNAVATALKDFFSKRLPPLLTQDMMAELEDISGAGRTSTQLSASYLNLEVITDRSCRLLALRGLLNKLPVVNFQVLKFVFQHFVKISENCKLNSMDSKNLAICWWPTLLPIEFSDMGRFEQMRPYLEDLVQTMIDQYPFLFCGKEAFVMV